MDPALGDVDESGFWEHLVNDAIPRFPRSSDAGPSGLRPSHLQDALRRRGGGAPLVTALALLCKQWAHGQLPPEHGPLCCGANLTPLRKPDGGVRPVAVGETLRCLAGKVLLATGVARSRTSKLAPTQVGVGVQGAAEAVVITTQNLVNTPGGTAN